jgi:hypothetical protein
MQLVYNGPKAERVMEFPIPVISKADIQARVTFKRGTATDCPDEYAKQCLAIAPEYFKEVPKKG